METNIKSWQEIKGSCGRPDVLLGNGFSLMFCDRFKYARLFDVFLDTLEEEDERELLKLFESSNFEFILRMLDVTKKTNECLGIGGRERIEQIVERVKNGLISTITSIHPKTSELDSDLIDRIARVFLDFGNIYTTNYDLLVYKISLKHNDFIKGRQAGKIYADLFGSTNIDYLCFKGSSVDQEEYKKIFYLHGALFICDDLYGFDGALKIRTNTSAELIEQIAVRIKKDFIPLFVAEGKYEHKVNVIKRNPYLSFCYENLKNSTNSLLILGHSLSVEFDKHIIEAIVNRPRNLVVAIYDVHKRKEEVMSEILAYKAKFNEIWQVYNRKTDYPCSINFVSSSTVFS